MRYIVSGSPVKKANPENAGKCGAYLMDLSNGWENRVCLAFAYGETHAEAELNLAKMGVLS